MTALAAAAAATPAVAKVRRVGGETILGEGAHTYRVRHNFPQLPDRFTWQTTHNVAVDAAGNLYVIHEGKKDQKDHPAIFVFDPEGKFVRAFGSEFQGGGHGIEVRKEGNEEFIYVCGYQDVKWYSGYGHPMAIEAIFEKFSDAFRSDERDHRAQYEYVRIGEQDDDIEADRSSYADHRIGVERSIIFE
jgi:hypothetical protein